MRESAPGTPPCKWYYRTWFVLLMLTPLCLGPFGLPLLWKSPQFSRRAKCLLSLVVVAYTIWLTVILVKATKAALHHLQEFLPILS